MMDAGELEKRYLEARALLERCHLGFSAYIMGRQLARPYRERLRAAIVRHLGDTESMARELDYQPPTDDVGGSDRQRRRLQRAIDNSC